MTKKKVDIDSYFGRNEKKSLCQTAARYPEIAKIFDQMIEKMIEDPLEYVVSWSALHAKLVSDFNYDLSVDAMTDAFRRRPGWSLVQQKLDALSRI